MNRKSKNAIFCIFSILISIARIHAQTSSANKLEVYKLHGMALSKNIKNVLTILDTTTITDKNGIKYKKEFENRFKYDTDRSTSYYLEQDSLINPLRKIYQKYWREILLKTSKKSKKKLDKNLVRFLRKENKIHHFTDLKINRRSIKYDSLGIQKKYIKSKGFYNQGYGITNGLYDLLIWKNQDTKTFKNVELASENIDMTVHFMSDFVTLGWTDYVTLGVSAPGGWVTQKKLEIYCMKDSYDQDTEAFKVNYLKHEGQHFADLKKFPKLSVTDLEYRGKLIEFIFGNNNLFKTIKFRIDYANKNSNNPHSLADYYVIRDMSKLIFNEEFVDDLEKWKEISKEEIHETAKIIFKNNTEALNNIGSAVKSYIK